MHFDKNGFAYTLDRATGELLVGGAVRAGQLGEARRPRDRPPGGGLDEAHRRVARHDARTSARSSRAARTRSPAAFSPATGLFYLSDQQPLHGLRSRASAAYIPGTPYVGASTPYTAGPGRPSRRLHRLGCGQAERAPGRSRSSTRCGAARSRPRGDVVFYGTLDGWFKAADAQTGAAALEVQGRIGRRRRPDHLPRPRRQAVRRGLRRHRRRLVPDLGRRALRRPGRRARAGELHARPRAAHEPGWHGVDLRAAEQQSVVS